MGKRSTFLWNHNPSSPRTEREKDGEEKTEGGMVSVFLPLLAIHFPPPGVKLPPLEAHRNNKKSLPLRVEDRGKGGAITRGKKGGATRIDFTSAIHSFSSPPTCFVLRFSGRDEGERENLLQGVAEGDRGRRVVTPWSLTAKCEAAKEQLFAI